MTTKYRIPVHAADNAGQRIKDFLKDKSWEHTPENVAAMVLANISDLMPDETYRELVHAANFVFENQPMGGTRIVPAIV